MRTKFKLKGFLPFLLSLGLTFIIVNFSVEIITNPFYQNKLLVSLIALIFFLLTWIWLVFGEVKNKLVVVLFSGKKIFVSKMGGLLRTEEYDSSEIEGWTYSILPSRGGNDEYLYIYSKGKKIAKTSEFYHKNYQAIKQVVRAQYNDLGFEQFSYIAELKEIFER